MKSQSLYLGLLACGLTVFAVFAFGGYRVNLTPSVPLGIYQQSKTGPYVEICSAPGITDFAVRRGYLHSQSTCMLKPVFGRPGDSLHYDRDGFTWNGVLLENSSPAPQDTRGRPLRHYPFGDYRIDEEHLWLISPEARSYDSRYFGPVAVSKVFTHARPVWLWE
jgi:conjugative transfer signal peptidase TraF